MGLGVVLDLHGCNQNDHGSRTFRYGKDTDAPILITAAGVYLSMLLIFIDFAVFDRFFFAAGCCPLFTY